MRVAGLSLQDRVRSLAVQKGLKVLFHFKRSQLRWFGNLTRMSLERLLGEVLQPSPTGRRPQGRPRTPWRRWLGRRCRLLYLGCCPRDRLVTCPGVACLTLYGSWDSLQAPKFLLLQSKCSYVSSKTKRSKLKPEIINISGV